MSIWTRKRLFGRTRGGGGGGGSSFTGGPDAVDPRTVAGARSGHGQVIIHWGPAPALQGP